MNVGIGEMVGIVGNVIGFVEVEVECVVVVGIGNALVGWMVGLKTRLAWLSA